MAIQLGSPRTPVPKNGNNFIRLALILAIVVSMSKLQFPALWSTDLSSSLNNTTVDIASILPSQMSSISDNSLSSPIETALNFTLQPFYQSPLILEKKCSVTVLLVDPYLSKDSLWALESVAANILPLETTCVLLKTSICNKGVSQDPTVSPEERYQQKAARIRSDAEPLFAAMIDRGQVRMTILEHQKYNLLSCLNYYNPSFMYENYQFWGPDEFDQQLDSDLILMTQGDAVLCHELHMDKWKDVAWVGAPWPARPGPLAWHFCSALPRIWNEGHIQVGNETPPPPPPPYPTEDQFCSDTQFGPQGNGGLGLRSRHWLRKAIEYCPVNNFTVSGLTSAQWDAARCRAFDTAAEDIYFVSILRGIGAPLPSNYEAALFSLELRSPGMIATQYNLNATFVEAMIQKRWYSRKDPTGMDYYEQMMRQNTSEDPLIPIGIHKPWNDYVKKRLAEKYLHEQCPYMARIVENSKWGQRVVKKMGITFS